MNWLAWKMLTGDRTKYSRAAEVLELVEIRDKVRALPHELSGGQQQRAAIARALVHEPKLLVCDEPTAALDAHSGRRVMQLMREATVQPGRAVMVVTHDSRVYEFGDRMVEMSDRRVDTRVRQVIYSLVDADRRILIGQQMDVLLQLTDELDAIASESTAVDELDPGPAFP